MPLFYAFESVVPIVKLGQTEAFRPDMGQEAGKWLQIVLCVVGLSGWLLGGLVTAGVLGLFQRK